MDKLDVGGYVGAVDADASGPDTWCKSVVE